MKTPLPLDPSQSEIVAPRSNTVTVSAPSAEKHVRILFAELDGKRIAYSSETEFLVQVGKGSKGGYRTRYRFVGNLGQAVFHYRCINIGNGYKKRLLAPSMNKPIIAKQTS